jgi:ribonuclease HII
MLKNNWTDFLIEVGCDEAGRGCLCGPVVAAAVIFPKDYYNEFIKDSKTLSINSRKKLEIEIKNNALDYAIAEVSPEIIDNINILNASIKAMHLAINQLKTKPNIILVDGNRFHNYPNIPHECIIKGDQKVLSIAAASILAKNHRDQLVLKMHEEFPNYGWNTNMGYATKKHRMALKENLSD